MNGDLRVATMKRLDYGRKKAGRHDVGRCNAQFAGRGAGQVFDFLDALFQFVEDGSRLTAPRTLIAWCSLSGVGQEQRSPIGIFRQLLSVLLGVPEISW